MAGTASTSISFKSISSELDRSSQKA
jgi:hypothetical protein